jgi:two-component system, chemotaxis family, sensor kinase CheA
MTTKSSIRDMFFEESEELLEALAEGLSLMNSGGHDDETVNAVFRAVHSIKGGAGAFKLTELVAFAHRFETVLDEVRSHRLDLTADLMHTLLRSADHLADLVEDARNERPDANRHTPDFLAALDSCLVRPAEDHAPAEEEEDFGFSAVAIDLDAMGGGAPGAAGSLDVYEIRLRPYGTLYANGHDPVLLITALADLGEIEVTLDLSSLPSPAEFDAARPTLAWTIRLTTSADEAAVREVFEFVEGLCDLTIRLADPPHGDEAEDAVQPPEGLSSALAEASLPTAGPDSPGSDAAAGRAAPDPALAEPRGPKPTLRVDLDRVDRLINSVGELIINQSMIAQRVQDLRLATDADVLTHVEDYRLLARALQEAVMAIRAQPVKPLFQRMSRIVREAADATGKSARLVTQGESAEVDKTVVERLADPLTHMVRNSVDHGLEPPEARIAAGKDPCGMIHLSAAHRSGAVIITIRDDGAGLNRRKILDIAKAKGLVPPGAEPTDAEIDALLFLPGFSTASTVSNLSGRGVGLDVVRNAVTALGGRISISSMPGQGTEFTISLPLTLAVLEGLVVSVAGQVMVIPITAVQETIRPGQSDLQLVGTEDRLLGIRGKFIPMLDVAALLGLPHPQAAVESRTLLLVETENRGQCALIVDRVLDQRQVVIKALDANYGTVPGVSAATVMGDGQVALILDTDALANNRVLAASDPWSGARANEGKRYVAA